MLLARLGLVVVVFVLSVSTATADGWPRFRGPNGAGISTDNNPAPTKWTSSENLKWTAELPGPGVSSPIVVGQRVFVTCYSGYGVDRDTPGEMEDLKRHLVCFDTATGEELWNRTVDAVLPEDPFDGVGVPSHGYASHTPVSDGEQVYVFFGKTGTLAFDMDGEQLWQHSVGTESDPWRWGSASSPILYKNLLIVVASAESQTVFALDKETGDEVWKAPASGLDGFWGTPVLAELDSGQMELVLNVPREVWAFDPDSGKLRWFAEANEAEQAQSSAVVSDGVIYTIAGRGGGSIAVRAGGDGDVTDSHVVWTGRETTRFGTPVLYDGRLYLVSNDVVSAIDIQSGLRVSQTRFEGASAARGGGRGAGGEGRGNFGPGGNRGRGGSGGGRGRRRGGFGSGDYASPVVADGKLYYLKGNGETFVFKLGEKLEQLAVNQVTQERESFGGTPAISDGRLYLRSNKRLYCVAEE